MKRIQGEAEEEDSRGIGCLGAECYGACAEFFKGKLLELPFI
jgi:hypothetical protein